MIGNSLAAELQKLSECTGAECINVAFKDLIILVKALQHTRITLVFTFYPAINSVVVNPGDWLVDC